MSCTEIRFKQIVGFENYLIYEDGRVFSIKNNSFLIPANNGNGYLKVNLYNPKVKQIYIHQLVALHFLDNTSNLKYIDHIDRDKTNNHVSNLRWTTARDNTKNTAGKPRYSVSKTGCNFYTQEFIFKIKEDFRNGMRVMEISRKYNIPRQSVSRFTKNEKRIPVTL